METNAFIKNEMKIATYYTKLLVKLAKKSKVIIERDNDEFYISNGCFIFRFAACLVDVAEVLYKAFTLPESMVFNVEILNNKVSEAKISIKNEYDNFVQNIADDTAIYTGLTFNAVKNHEICVFSQKDSITFFAEKYVEPMKNYQFSVSKRGISEYMPIVYNANVKGVVVLPYRVDSNSGLFNALTDISKKM